MTGLKGQFDRYSLTARVLPGLITVLPVLLVVGILVPPALTNYVLGLIVASGLIFLMAAVVRTIGRRAEDRLVSAWDGQPTTHLLRYRTTKDRATLDRRRKTLEALLGRGLPNARSESANPAKADQEYVAATRQLISLVRQHEESFPRVREENINYGFIRNLYGMKTFGISATACAGTFVGVGHALFGASTALSIDALLFLLLVAWVCYVTESGARGRRSVRDAALRVPGHAASLRTASERRAISPAEVTDVSTSNDLVLVTRPLRQCSQLTFPRRALVAVVPGPGSPHRRHCGGAVFSATSARKSPA